MSSSAKAKATSRGGSAQDSLSSSLQEQSLVLLKPDAVQRGLVGEIISRFERCGLKLIAMKMVYPNEQLAGEHYAADEEWLVMVGEKQKEAYKKKGVVVEESEREIGLRVREQLMQFLSMSPVVALVLQGHNAVAHIRKLVGATSPGDAPPGTIRGDYSFDTYQLADASRRPIQNLIHASGTVEEAKREIAVWFSKEELHEWTRIDETLLYRQG
ncbi:nucleoside-diphosphate kinase [Candidatus Woesearchaeota archaeon]|nr:MAG: nucleoside-diphosphate kinase [Candidatus Woesearchaeota archaeon]